MSAAENCFLVFFSFACYGWWYRVYNLHRDHITPWYVLFDFWVHVALRARVVVVFFSCRMISTKKRVLWPADGVWLGKMRCTFCGLVDVPVISGKCTIPWNPICQRLLLWTKNCVNSGRDERMSQRFMNWSTAINCFIYFIYPATITTESQHFLPSEFKWFSGTVNLSPCTHHTTQRILLK